MFPEYYTEYFKKYSSAVSPLRRIIANGPISYTGQKLLQIDIDNLKAACEGLDVSDIFMPATGPSGFGRNEYYKEYEEYLNAVAEAMREEYLGIVEAGFILQVDDPWLIDMLGNPAEPIESRRRSATIHVEALNHALRGIPEDRIRHHTCYGLNHGPRLTDIPLKTALEFTFQINAQAYSFEVMNPRHMHEWRQVEEVGVPDGKILIPGLLGHANNYVEHPELIAEFICNYAVDRRQGERDRRSRLWVLVACQLRARGASDRGVAEVQGVGRGRCDRQQETLGLGHTRILERRGIGDRGARTRYYRGYGMTDTAEQVKFPGPDEIEGFWAFDKMHAPRPLASVVAGPGDVDVGGGIHQGAGRVRLPDRRLEPGDQPLLLHGVPSASRRGRGRGPHEPLPRHARQEGAARRQALDQRVAAADPRRATRPSATPTTRGSATPSCSPSSTT